MEWSTFVFDAFKQGGGCSVFLAYGVWITWQRGKDRLACETALTAAQKKTDEINEKIREWMMLRVGE